MNLYRLAALAAVALGAAGPARADLTITFTEVGPDVVATATGSLDLTGLTYAGPSYTFGVVAPFVSSAGVGPVASSLADIYTGAISGPSSFGTGGAALASSGTGDRVFLYPLGSQVGVTTGYVSGGSLSGSSTFANQSFASLGLTAGTYVYTLPSNKITVQVGPAAVPEPATTALLGMGVFGVAGVVRRFRKPA